MAIRHRRAPARRVRSLLPVVVLFATLALMVLAWWATTPLGTAADEPDHYTKALAAGRGDLAATRPSTIPPTRSRPSSSRERARDTATTARACAGWRRARGPSRCRPDGPHPDRLLTASPASGHDAPGGLQARDDVRAGRAPLRGVQAVEPRPTCYLLWRRHAAGRQWDVVRAYRLGRAAMGVMCLILLGLSLLLLWIAGRRAVARGSDGRDDAHEPLELLGPQSQRPGISGATCSAAAFLRLLRRRTRRAGSGPPPPRAASRSPRRGPAAAVPGVHPVVHRLALRLRRAGRGPAAPGPWPRAADGVLRHRAGGRAVLVALHPQLPPRARDARSRRGCGRGLPRTLREAVGGFAGDYFVPVPLGVAWAAVLAALVIAAAVVAVPQERRRLALVATTVLVSRRRTRRRS